jgi:hypothetical protein
VLGRDTVAREENTGQKIDVSPSLVVCKTQTFLVQRYWL